MTEKIPAYNFTQEARISWVGSWFEGAELYYSGFILLSGPRRKLCSQPQKQQDTF